MMPARGLSRKDVHDLLAADAHLSAGLDLARPFLDDDQVDAVWEVSKDIAIRVVEDHYKPDTLECVRGLRPSLRRAGIGYLLDRWRTRMIQEKDLVGGARSLFSRQVEKWINVLWDEAELDPLADASVSSTQDLIGWLTEHVGAYVGLDDVLDGDADR
jgi:hypothetical protein